MKLDYTRFTAFRNNWELFRIIYLQNKVPLKKPANLDVGGAFHKIEECNFKKYDAREYAEAMREFELVSVTEAENLYPVLQRYKHDNNINVIGSEVEFEWQIPDTPHSIIGRSDWIVGSTTLTAYPADLKTLDNSTTQEQLESMWVHNYQAEFNILGQRNRGYTNPEGRFDVFGIRKQWKAKPEKKYQKKPLPVEVLHHTVKRSPFELQLFIKTFIRTCDVIEFLIDKYGIDDTWGHYVHGMFDGYRCRTGECEYAELCGQHVNNWDLTNYKDREEHLDLLKETSNVNTDNEG